MVKCRTASMPKHLQEEDDRLMDILCSRHDPDEEVTQEAFIAECRAIIEEKGSPELRAWHKKQREAIEENRREGRELC